MLLVVFITIKLTLILYPVKSKTCRPSGVVAWEELLGKEEVFPAVNDHFRVFLMMIILIFSMFINVETQKSPKHQLCVVDGSKYYITHEPQVLVLWQRSQSEAWIISWLLDWVWSSAQPDISSGSNIILRWLEVSYQKAPNFAIQLSFMEHFSIF